MALTDDQVARFSRQLLVPGFGEAVQERLLSARVRVVGADGPATAALVALVQAGIGRIWVDDEGYVAPADRQGWIYAPGSVGSPRAAAAREALSPLSRHTVVEPYPAGGVPDAALVFASSAAQGIAMGEVARKAGIPHVMVEPDAEGGAVVSIPVGAPCFSCARSVAGVGRPPVAGIAGLSALAAAELLHLLAQPVGMTGRRIDVVRGVPTTHPTARSPGCACAQPAVPPSLDEGG